MKNRIFFAVLITTAASIILHTSCNKKPDQVGLGLQPASSELSVAFDNEAGLLSYSVREDSVRTDVNVIKTGMLGSMLDPVFGKTTAEIFTQLRLSENGHNFGSDVVLDSIVLSLTYSGFYGDTMTEQTIRVYELTQDMVADSAYYSNQSLDDFGIALADISIVPAPADSITVDSSLQIPQLRIRLDDSFGQRLIDADPLVYEDNEAWLDYMKGFRITTEPVQSGGGMLLFDMQASATALTIYYRTGDPQDTVSFVFQSNSNCARFTAFDHNEYLDASPEFKSQVLEDDTASGNELFYLQGMGGVKAILRLPDIEDYFGDEAIAINEARLVFNIYDDGSELSPPPQLSLALIDEDGDYLPLPDASEVSSYYSGLINDAETGYYFRISRHVQQVLNGDSPNYPLVLLLTGASFRANRLILYGGDEMVNADDRMVLNIIYTKVN